MLASACASRTPVLSSLRKGSPFADTNVDTRTLVAAWAECRGEVVEDQYLACHDVFKELAYRREDVVRRVYARPLDQVRSCDEAEASVALAERALGPLRSTSRWEGKSEVRDDGVIPAWAALHAIRTDRGDVVVTALPLDHLQTHGAMLLKCGRGPALGKLLAVYEANRAASPSPPEETSVFARSLVRRYLHEAVDLADGDSAPVLVAAAVRGESRPEACPPTAKEVSALLRSPDPKRRVLGCQCVDRIPTDARAEASTLRRRLMDYDTDQHSVSVQEAPSGPMRPLVEGPAAVPLALPQLVAGVLSSFGGHRSERVFPVRDACLWAAPPWETKLPRTREAPWLEVLKVAGDTIRVGVYVDEYPSSLTFAVVSVDERGEPDGKYCATTTTVDPRPPYCAQAKLATRHSVTAEGAIDPSIVAQSNVQVLENLALPGDVRRVRIEVLHDRHANDSAENAPRRVVSAPFAVPAR